MTLARMVGCSAGAAVALLWRPDLGGFWPGLIAFLVMAGGRAALGQLAGRLSFRPPSSSPPDQVPPG